LAPGFAWLNREHTEEHDLFTIKNILSMLKKFFCSYFRRLKPAATELMAKRFYNFSFVVDAQWLDCATGADFVECYYFWFSTLIIMSRGLSEEY